MEDKDCVVLFAHDLSLPITVTKTINDAIELMNKIFPDVKPEEVSLHRLWYDFWEQEDELLLRWNIDPDEYNDMTEFKKLFNNQSFYSGAGDIIARPIKFGDLKLFSYDL